MTLITAPIYFAVMRLAAGERADALPVSPGILPPMGVIFALIAGLRRGGAAVVVMLASQDRPFTGQLGLDPDALEQVSPPSAERLGADSLRPD